LAVNRDDWNDLSARLITLKTLIPPDELPADPPHAVTLFWPAPCPAGDLAGLSEEEAATAARRHEIFLRNLTIIAKALDVALLPRQYVVAAKSVRYAIERLSALTPAALRPEVTEEEIERVLRFELDLSYAGIGDDPPTIGGIPQAAQAVVALFRDADRGGKEGAR
jgi:hypothetical protein